VSGGFVSTYGATVLEHGDTARSEIPSVAAAEIVVVGRWKVPEYYWRVKPKIDQFRKL